MNDINELECFLKLSPCGTMGTDVLRKGVNVMLRHKAYTFRIYPNRRQERLIVKTIGCSRFVFNRFLAEWNNVYRKTGKGLTYSECSNRLTQIKKELEWLREVDSTALQSSLKNLEDAFRRFFRKQTEAPRFKSRKNALQSYTSKQVNGNIAIVDNTIKLPKLGLLRVAKSREVDGRILNATIRKNPSGKYVVSILAEVDISVLPKTGSACGLDVGLKNLAIVSDGTVYRNPRHFRKLEARLAREQRILSRRTRGGSNWYKQRIRVARIQEKIANARRDYLHKISTEIVKNHDIIGIEDLQISNMLKNRTLSKAISEVSWSKLRTMLEYKARW